MDVLGSLYLAYDLLGGTVLEVADAGGNVLDCIRRGLRPGTRSVFRFGCGDYTGVTTSVELNRTARGLDRYSLPWEAVFASVRGLAFGAGLYRMLGVAYATAFAILITIG